MIVKYFGHSMVQVDNLVIDPHDGESIGLPQFRVKADFVIMTHEHYDHNAVEVVEYKQVLQTKRRVYSLDSMDIEVIPCYHDKRKGQLFGRNNVIVISSRGFKIVHLGDLGTTEGCKLDHLSGANLVAIPVGGVTTMEVEEAARLIDVLKPVNLLPVHYWVKGLLMPLDPIDKFLEKMKGSGYQTKEIEVGFEINMEGEKDNLFVLKNS